MPLLTDAPAVYAGDIAALKVYLGDTLVWEPAAGWGPDEFIFAPGTTPWGTSPQGYPFTFGTKFTPVVDGQITGVRFWSYHLGTSRPVSIWSETGVRLAHGVGGTEVATGWVVIPLDAPLPVRAGVPLVTSYGWHNSWSTFGYTPEQTPVSASPNLIAGKGSYFQGDMDSFPSLDGGQHYYADVVFQAGGAPAGEWTPASIPGLVAWIDPAQDMYADGERVDYYREHANGLEFTAPAGAGPIFRAGGSPYLDFTGTGGLASALQRTWVNGMTLISVNAVMGGSYPMMVVVGPDANGIEMRHSGSGQELVVMYGWYAIVFAHPTALAHTLALYSLRVQPGAASAAWTNSVQAFGPAPGAMDSAPQSLWIGRRQGGYYFVGPMYETLVYDGPVSDDDMALLQDYLQAKHGLPTH